MLAVTGPAQTHRLTTLAAIKAELQLIKDIDDVFLTNLIDQASATVRSWCRRTFALETVRETFYVDNPEQPLLLARFPVTEIEAVAVAGAELDPGEYEVEEDSGFLYRLDASSNRFTSFSGRVLVDYQAGYLLPGASARSLPEDIERATIAMIKLSWFARTRDPLIRAEAVEGVGSLQYYSSDVYLPAEVEGLLTPYRSPRLV
jgi:uncharacterized phiE125 gp8 family phage protein